jgi:hypothetical protein
LRPRAAFKSSADELNDQAGSDAEPSMSGLLIISVGCLFRFYVDMAKHNGKKRAPRRRDEARRQNW